MSFRSKRILRTELLDGSVLSTVKLPFSAPGPCSLLEAFVRDDEITVEEEQARDGYWYETCLLTQEDDCVLRRHKTEAEAIVWHEEYLDKVLEQTRSK